MATKKPSKQTELAGSIPPAPVNRMVKAGMVRVRAKRALFENGTRYEAGEEFEVESGRAESLAYLTEEV